MKFITLLFVSLGLLITPVLADDNEEKMKAAKRYLTVYSVKDFMAKTIDNMVESLPEESKAEFLALFDNFDYTALEDGMVDAMMQTFSAEEINVLADFYQSPIGFSVMSKMDGYISLVWPIMQQEVTKVFQKPAQTNAQ